MREKVKERNKLTGSDTTLGTEAALREREREREGGTFEEGKRERKKNRGRSGQGSPHGR